MKKTVLILACLLVILLIFLVARAFIRSPLFLHLLNRHPFGWNG